MTLVNETSDGKNIENTKRKRYQFAMTQRYATVSNEGHASSMHRIDELRERERERKRVTLKIFQIFQMHIHKYVKR